jgi:hypothetical protein
MLAYLQIFADQAEELNLLDDAARGRFVSALLAYATQGTVPELSGEERFLWPSFRRTIDAAIAKATAQSENGKKGGSQSKQSKTNGSEPKPNEAKVSQPKPKQAKASQAEANASQTAYIQEQEQDQEHIQEHSICVEVAKAPNARASTRFTPPTPEEVTAYAKEHSYQVDGQRFCDFYASKGWKVGTTPMKDWKAAVRNWATRDKTPSTAPPAQRGPKVVREQVYTQRAYEDDEGLPDWMVAKLKESMST